MKDLKSFKNTEMGIDVNDIKILINAGFQYLTRTCHQWAKDHPLVSSVLLFFYLLYLFSPSLFSILFYTFPLVICTAILLGGSQIRSEKNHDRDIIIKKQDDKTSKTDNNHRHPYLQPQMSRRTFGKDKNKDDAILKENSIISDDMNHVKTSLFLDNVEKTQNLTRSNSQSDTESQDEDEPSNKAVQWTEDDQRNLMDLGSSEIERNKRLESLIAKRRARKLLSMQPRRNNHIDYLGDYYNHYPNDHHLDSVGSIMVARGGIDQHQPGSAPSVLLPTRNPFDIPYEPHEEKPVLTGGSFEEEFFASATQLKDSLFSSSHESFSEATKEDHPVSKLLPSFFSNPKPADKPRFSRFRSQSDAEESVKENIAEELFQQGNDQTPDQVQESPQEVQRSQVQSDCRDQATTLPLQEEEYHKLEEDPFTQNTEPKSDSVSTTGSKKEEELGNINNEEATVNINEDQRSVNKDNDDGDESSSSSSCETSINATKNEAFRNSVKKVLTCLVKNKGVISPTIAIPTKMEERSFYTCKPHHTPTYSIASDMQVEVSETGSPRSTALDPSSPTTDQESMVYDGDVERDDNSGDEDLWGASPHPIRLGNFGTKFKLPDIIEEGSNNRGSDFEISHNATDPPTLLRGEQAPEIGANSSLSPRSIMPEENRKDLMDNKSTNGDIIEPRSSISSSSESLASQMIGKSEHLAEYLANLAPSESGSNVLEDPGPSHVRETSAEEITIQDESNPMFEMDEDKEDSKESKELEESQESSDKSSSTGHSEAPKDTSSASNEYITEDELNMDHKDQTPFFAEQNQDSGILEVDSTPLEKAVTEEVGTACQEDVTDQSRSVEEQGVELENEVEIISENQVACR